MMVIFTALGLTYAKILKSGLRNGQYELRGIKAFFLAESGIEYSMAELNNNTDLDSDGTIGNISWKTMAPDGSEGFLATYNEVNKTIQGTGTAGGANFAARDVIATLEEIKFTGALQCGNAISTILTVSGWVYDNADAKTSIELDPIIVFGEQTVNPNLVIPTVSLSDYFNMTPLANRSSGTTTWSTGPPHGDGMYYHTGNLTIRTRFLLNGTLVVNGNLIITDITNPNALWIMPLTTSSGLDPAIIANNITINNTPNANLGGLVYASQDANITSPRVTITGGLVTGGNITFNGATDISCYFDPNMDSSHFTGNNGWKIEEWKGHL